MKKSFDLLGLTHRLLYDGSLEKCYKDREREGYAAMGKCDGLAGGDKSTDHLQMECINCPFFYDQI